ncbi:hypothetical protein [Sorangium sp. So ce1389]|uniref:hypothetical protein n=1 Tax=Sorangium sp. So ce1389 TaxID=3133336 RepID=UPI003F62F9CE
MAGWGADAVSYAVIAVGVTDVCVQGIVLERPVKVLGDARVLALGLGLVVLALATMALTAIHPSAPAFIDRCGRRGVTRASDNRTRQERKWRPRLDPHAT